MRIQGHREGNITHQGLLEGGRARGLGDWEGITLGEIPNVDDGGIDADSADHHGMCIPM